MAKIVAAYIAHGRRYHGPSSAMARYQPDGAMLQDWKRIFCNFALIRQFAEDGEMPRLILFSDHVPPSIDGRLLEFFLLKFGVEIRVIPHLWRPEAQRSSAEFFVFDALEQLTDLSERDDQILVFSARASVVHSLDALFDDVAHHDVIFAEENFGDLDEEHVDALRDRMIELRAAYQIPFPTDAINAISPDFMGFYHNRLKQLMTGLRRVFPQTLSRQQNGMDGFRTAGEILAALLAKDGFYRPPSSQLSGLVAAIPEDFAVAKLSDVPVVLPGYGREPDIETLFSALLPNRVGDLAAHGRSDVSDILKQNSYKRSFLKRMSGMLTSQRTVTA